MSPINPTEVLTPADYGKVYYFNENAEKLRWLYEGGCHETRIEKSTKVDDIDVLYKSLELITVDLSDSKSDLKVVRVFSKWLIPINFGFNSAHYTHQVLQHSFGVEPDSLKMPHYFA